MTTQEIEEHEKWLENYLKTAETPAGFKLVPVYEHDETDQLEITNAGWYNQFAGFLLKPDDTEKGI